jgi:hypothetical protein
MSTFKPQYVIEYQRDSVDLWKTSAGIYVDYDHAISTAMERRLDHEWDRFRIIKVERSVAMEYVTKQGDSA